MKEQLEKLVAAEGYAAVLATLVQMMSAEVGTLEDSGETQQAETYQSISGDLLKVAVRASEEIEF